MKKHIILAIAAVLAAAPLWAKSINKDYIVVTDYVKADGVTDVTAGLQKLIDENPGRALYFPDGTYLISKSIVTSAAPERSTDFKLSNYAVIKAAPGWDSDDAMIRLGAKEEANNIRLAGSNYSFTGGIIDGGVEKMTDRSVTAISIDSGRESVIKGVSIKNVKRGIHLKWGANGGSSDADISDVNIVGTGAADSVGLQVDGNDNTFSNMRIADVYTGVYVTGGGNNFRNIHPLFIWWSKGPSPDYTKSVAFKINSKICNNWFEFCYGDQFSTAFEFDTAGSSTAVIKNCFCFWYDYTAGHPHTAIHAKGKFLAFVSNLDVSFIKPDPLNTVLLVDEPGGKGIVSGLRTDEKLMNNKEKEAVRDYLDGKILGTSGW